MKRTLLTVLGLLVLAAMPAGAQAKNVVAHDVAQSPDEVRAYWTEERMRNARPRDTREPKGKPGTGGGSGSGATYGAVATPYAGLMKANGKVFFTERGVNYVCSGTSISTGTSQAVWTAGHCVNEGPGNFVTNWAFVPAYIDGTRPYGTYVATRLYTTSAWKNNGDFSYDLGAATVSASPSGNLAVVAGGRNVAIDYNPLTMHVISYGYPAAGKFNGQRQYFCSSTVTYRDSGNPQPMGIPCNMTGGSSGGGWINDGGDIVSVNSYGYQSLKNVMFGPFQNAVAANLASCARGGSCSSTALGS